MLRSKPDPKLAYFSRGMNYFRSCSAEALKALHRSADESEQRRILNELLGMACVREGLERDPAGIWRFRVFKAEI